MPNSSAPVDLEELREDVKGYLRLSRISVLRRGHDWDVADAADVIVREYGGLLVGVQSATAEHNERVAILATGADLRRAVTETREHIGNLMDSVEAGSRVHRELVAAYWMLDVSTAETRLMRPPEVRGQANRHRGRPSPPAEPFTSPARSSGLRGGRP